MEPAEVGVKASSLSLQAPVRTAGGSLGREALSPCPSCGSSSKEVLSSPPSIPLFFRPSCLIDVSGQCHGEGGKIQLIGYEIFIIPLYVPIREKPLIDLLISMSWRLISLLSQSFGIKIQLI